MTADGNRAGKIGIHLVRLAGDGECSGEDARHVGHPGRKAGRALSLILAGNVPARAGPATVTPSFGSRELMVDCLGIEP